MTDKILAKIKEILIRKGLNDSESEWLKDKVVDSYGIYEEAEHELMGEDYAKENPKP